MNIRVETTLTSLFSLKDNHPTLHKGNMGDVLPLGGLERIQEGILEPPPWS